MITVSAALETLLDKNHIAPELRVSLYDTTKTVPSNGFDVKYYTFDAGQSLTTDWPSKPGVTEELDGNEYSTVLSFDWGEGAPPPISKVDNFAARWTGYFYARYSGVYTFYLDSGQLCGTQIKFNSSYLTFSDGTTSGSPWYDGTLQEKTTELSASTASLTAGEWYPIEVDFYTGSNKNGASLAYFTAKYKEPTGATTSLDIFGDALGVTDYESDSNKKPLSAGVVNNASAFLTAVELTGITDYELDRPFGEVAQAAFSVNLSWVSVLDRSLTNTGDTSVVHVDSTDGAPSAGVLEINDVTHIYTSKASDTFTLKTAANILSTTGTVVKLKDTPYAYDRNSNSFGPVKPYRLVRFEIGMNNGSGNIIYIDRLWGNVYPDPEVSRTIDGNTLTVLVQDFSAAMNVDYNKNYPNQSSYSMADLYDGSTFGLGANGLTRPVTYDGWLLDAAVRDLAIKANIDPVWMYGRKELFDGTDFDDTFSSYYVRGEDVYLDKKPFYGNPENVSEEEADDQYIWSFGYGEKLLSMTYDFCKNFGYGFNFNELGYMVFNGMDIPQEKLFAADYATAGTVVIASDANWTKTTNLSSPKGIDMVTSTSGDTILFNMNGRYADLILTRDQASGASITLKVDLAAASGVDQIRMDGSKLTKSGGVLDVSYVGDWSYYDGSDPDGAVNHSVVRIDMLTYDSHELSVELTSGTMKVSAAFSYDILASESVLDMDTRDIQSLDDSLSFMDMRNQVVVVGSLLGKFTDTGGDVVNPNNPIYRHVVSSAIDLASLYDTTVKNYTGRLLPFEVYNPKIFSNDRADYLATTVLEKYRRAQHSPSFDVRPNPRLQLLDGLTLTDINTGLTTTDDELWVLGYSESLSLVSNGIEYAMDTKLTGHKPLLSFQVKNEPNRTDFLSASGDVVPVINVLVKNAGVLLGGNGYKTSDTRWTMSTSPGWTADMWKGHELWITDEEDPWLVVGNGAGYIDVHTDSDALPTYASGSPVYSTVSYDPFDSDRGSPIEIHYDQVFTGKMTVDIHNQGLNLIANSINLSKESEVEDWGSEKVLYWDGTDRNNGEFLTVDRGPFFVKFMLEQSSGPGISVTTENTVYTAAGSTLVDKGLTQAKILNHGLYVELEPFDTSLDVGSGDNVVFAGNWDGDLTDNHDDTMTLTDSDIPASASGWTGMTLVTYRNTNYIQKDDPNDEQARFKEYRNNINVAAAGSLKADTSQFGMSHHTSRGAYKVVSDTGVADRNDFTSNSNAGLGLGVRLSLKDFYTKLDIHKDPIILEDPDDSFGSINWLQVQNMLLSGIDVYYDGSIYSTGAFTQLTDYGRLPFVCDTYPGNPSYVAKAYGTFYWNSFSNSIQTSAMQIRKIGNVSSSNYYAMMKNVDSQSLACSEQFGNLNGGLYPLCMLWPKTYADDSQRPYNDSVISYAHHNFQSPTKATPPAYGKITARVAVDRFDAGKLMDSSDEFTLAETDIVALDNYDMYFNLIGKSLGGQSIGSFLTEPTINYPGGGISWRFRVYVDILDRAGRKTGNCRPGIKRALNSRFEFYEDVSNYIEFWWAPASEGGYDTPEIIRADDSANTTDLHSHKIVIKTREVL